MRRASRLAVIPQIRDYGSLLPLFKRMETYEGPRDDAYRV
jgi:hypothetical protein